MNGRLMHATTSLVGNVVQVVVKDGSVVEGVLTTFSPNVSHLRWLVERRYINLVISLQYEIVVEMATEVDPKSATNNGSNLGNLITSLTEKKPIHNTYIFELQNVVMLSLVNVDLDYASRGA